MVKLWASARGRPTSKYNAFKLYKVTAGFGVARETRVSSIPWQQGNRPKVTDLEPSLASYESEARLRSACSTTH